MTDVRQDLPEISAGFPHDHSRERLDDMTSELVANGSIELSGENLAAIDKAAHLLPFGMAVFVPRPRSRSLADNMDRFRALNKAGFDPVPHIAARAIPSETVLREFLDRAAAEAGVHRVLVIGGDDPEVKGPFKNSAALVESGVLADTGIQEVYVAGYPEGHPNIPLDVLEQDLDSKIALIKEQGMGINIVTQFSFLPSRVVEYCNHLAHRVPGVPVYVGLAGPVNAVRLLKYARLCGVSESIRALSSMGVKIATLASHTNPDEQMEVLARYNAARTVSNVIGIHIFSFGGFAKSAQWMRSKVRQK